VSLQEDSLYVIARRPTPVPDILLPPPYHHPVKQAIAQLTPTFSTFNDLINAGSNLGCLANFRGRIINAMQSLMSYREDYVLPLPDDVVKHPGLAGRQSI